MRPFLRGPAGHPPARSTLLILAALAGCTTPPSAPRTTSAPPPPAAADVAPILPAAAPAHGQASPADRPDPLTLDAAVARALARNRDIVFLRHAEDIALQERRAATDLDDPQFTAAWGENKADGFQEQWTTEQSTTTARSQGSSTESQADLSPLPGSSTLRQTTATDSSRATTRRSDSAYESAFNADDGDSYRVGLRLYVPNPWLLSPRVAARKADMQAAAADRRAAEWTTAIAVHRLFLDIAYLTNDLALAAMSVGLHDTIQNAVTARAAATVATAAETLSATQSRLRAAAQRDRARLDADIARRELADLLNLPAAELHLDTASLGDLPRPLPLRPRAEIETIALRAREDLQAAYWRMRAAQDAYREVRAAGIPWIAHVDASYGESRDRSTETETSSGTSTSSTTGRGTESAQGTLSSLGPGGTVGAPRELRLSSSAESSSSSSRTTESGSSTSRSSEDGSAWQVGFMVNVPIFTWLMNNADDVALAEYKLAAAHHAEAAAQVGLEVANAYDECQAAAAEWERYAAAESAFLGEIRRTLSSLEETPDLPPDEIAAVKLDVVGALRLWREAKLHYRKSLLELERVSGVSLRELVQPVP